MGDTSPRYIGRKPLISRKAARMAQNLLVCVALLMSGIIAVNGGKVEPDKMERLTVENMKFDRAYHASIQQVSCAWAVHGNCGQCHN